MILRHALLLGGSGRGTGSIEPPSDPSLNTPRPITAPYGMNQNTTQTTGAGATYKYTGVRVLEDAADMTLIFHGSSQGFITNPMSFKVTVQRPGGPVVPVKFGGSINAQLALDGVLESDVVAGPFAAGSDLSVRVYVPGDQTVNIGYAGEVKAGDHLLDEPYVPDGEFLGGGPFPLMLLGRARQSVVSLGLFGDSIAAQGIWWREALAEHNVTGVNFGRNVMRFDGRWLNEATVRGLTGMLVQFGVNDLGGQHPPAQLWATAVACYDYINGLNPGLPLWQTTPTPTVQDTAGDNCATLVGQTPDFRTAARAAWLEFLRDGAPCDPETLVAVAVGAEGVRAGEEGHPLRGIVDIAAVVEHNNENRWRVDQGPAGGDGVHPSNLGEHLMAAPVSQWVQDVIEGVYDPPVEID